MRLFVILFFIAFIHDVRGQGRTLSGKVIGSEFRTKKDKAPHDFWEVNGAKVFWKDSLLATTDENGDFRIEVSAEMDTVRIGWIGMYPEEIRISEKCEYIEVILLPDVIYDFVTVRKEERLRKKDRAILPDLYRKAFAQGIFRQREPCR